MSSTARRCLTVLLLLMLLHPPAAFPEAPEPAAPDPRLDDKLIHFLAGLAVGLSAGGVLYALAPEAELHTLPLAAGGAGLAAGLLAGAGKELLDARRDSAGRVEAADLLHTLLGGLTGGVLAEALVRSGQTAGLEPRWIGIVLTLSGGAAGLKILCFTPS
jgi:hypothetical protein